MNKPWLGFLALVVLLVSSCYCAEFRPIVLIYDGSMRGFAEGIASILNESGRGEEFVVETDPSAAASMLALPNLKCLVLTSVSPADLTQLVEPVLLYFQSGGSAIGFYGCSWQAQVGDLARLVFPAFANATGGGTRKSGIYVNEYVRADHLAGIGENLPESFDLVGQFYGYAADGARNPVDVEPVAGRKTVLFRERKSGSPLAIAYEGEAGGRTFTLTGLFLRDKPTAENYYGKLLEQPEFRSLLKDAYVWVTEGNLRFNRYSASYQEIVSERRKAQDDLVSSAREKQASRRRRVAILLAVSWGLGLACIVALVRWSFQRQTVREPGGADAGQGEC